MASLTTQFNRLKVKLGITKDSNRDEPLRIAIGNQNGDKQLPLNRIKTTKYTLLTFIPLNIYEQFRRAVYFYYLIITIITFFVNDTISPMSSLLPLVFVIGITALKEGFEDFRRSKSDKLVNTVQVTVIRKGREQIINSEYIVPGDLVLVKSSEDVPCDLVLLQAGEDSKCFVTTANLDGETNLKTIFGPPNFTYTVERQSQAQLGSIVCEVPTADLYNFTGHIELKSGSNEKVLPLTINNLLLRGVQLKGTERAIGCAIYTGMNTKLQLNSRYTSNKSASSEKYVNKFIIAMICVMIILVIVCYFLERHEEADVVPLIAFLGPPINYNAFIRILQEFFSMFVLFNYVIPISMYMNMEGYRVFGALFMRADQQLYDEETDQPCIVNTSNLNEDLGQINLLFSDKTGTLTKNQMNFQKCFVGGDSYKLVKSQLYSCSTAEKFKQSMFSMDMNNFFEALCLCHTVQVLQINAIDATTYLTTTEQLSRLTADITAKYQASSPDERALLEGSADLGLVYEGDECNALLLRRFLAQPNGGFSTEQLRFERLQVLEFTSDRKRMSIIVRDSNGVIWLYSKGAESSIFPLCNPSTLIQQADVEINKFAREGYRTLAVARRSLTATEYARFAELFKDASSELHNRNELFAKCYETVEHGLDFLGATALEDALQYHVADTLEALQQAGIKIWVLTGDKVETALNIGLACKHIPAGSAVYQIINVSDPSELKQRLNELEHRLDSCSAVQFSLVVDGISIATLLEHASKQFSKVAMQCTAVLCCRLSPLQKSEIVLLMKKTQKQMLTAAIGDGANDVSMIQQAHVGIGITGREGRQAALCADYAIAKFCLLQRLLLVHGHYNSERLRFLVLFYCYKNVLFSGCMMLFQVYCLYSATSVYNATYLWAFDTFYLSLGFTYLGISDKCYSEATLTSNPSLYKTIAHNQKASWWNFAAWMLNAIVHTVIIFYFAYAVINNNNIVLSAGQTADYAIFGTMLMWVTVVVGNLKIILASRFMSYVNLGFILASIAAYMFSTFIYNIETSDTLYGVYNQFVSSLPMWLFSLVCTVTCLLPDYVYKAFMDIWWHPKHGLRQLGGKFWKTSVAYA